MAHRSGFTIVELVIVMVIMAILLVVGTVNFSGLQANARDNERNTDVNVIANGLEVRYKSGNPVVTSPAYVTKGAYPSVTEMQHMFGTSQASFTPPQIIGGYALDALPGTRTTSFNPPGLSTSGFIMSCTSSCGAPENYTSLATLTTKNTYVYEPIDVNGNLCIAAECVRYNLYWRTETATPDTNLPISTDKTFHRIRSEHQ